MQVARTVRTQLLHDDLDEDSAAVGASSKDSANTAAARRLRMYDDLDEDNAAVDASAKDNANTAAVRLLRRRQCCSRCKCQGQCAHSRCSTT